MHLSLVFLDATAWVVYGAWSFPLLVSLVLMFVTPANAGVQI